jgi:hypothetical protein
MSKKAFRWDESALEPSTITIPAGFLGTETDVTLYEFPKTVLNEFLAEGSSGQLLEDTEIDNPYFDEEVGETEENPRRIKSKRVKPVPQVAEERRKVLCKYLALAARDPRITSEVFEKALNEDKTTYSADAYLAKILFDINHLDALINSQGNCLILHKYMGLGVQEESNPQAATGQG